MVDEIDDKIEGADLIDCGGEVPVYLDRILSD